MKYLLKFMVLLSICFNISSCREKSVADFSSDPDNKSNPLKKLQTKEIMCPQIKHNHHPVASRHRWYQYISCMEGHASKNLLSELGIKLGSLYGKFPIDVGYIIVYRHSQIIRGFKNIEYTSALKNYFSLNANCLQWDNFRTTYCSAEDIDVDCDDYRDRLYQYGFINDYDKKFYKDENLIPMLDVSGKYIAGISCEEFDTKPTLGSLWKPEGVSQDEIDRHLEDYEYEKNCLAKGGTNPDCIRRAPNFERYWGNF